MQENRKYEVGQHVIYVDPHGVRRDALVTTWWSLEHYRSTTGEPGCNVVFVANDEKREDQYGRQKEHATSVIHKTAQPAPGNYWVWPDE